MDERRPSVPARLCLVGALASLLASCSAVEHGRPGVGPYSEQRPVRVVTTTPLLADIVKNVGAARVDVHSIVPIGADPHGYEPSLRDIRDIAYADLAVSNYLMLEEHSQIKAIDATIGERVRHISVAEGATRYGAQVLTLTENSALDTAWLGLRVSGGGADRSTGVQIIATGMSGPGELSAYITETFGNPSVYVNSADGFDHDVFELPADAHTHMSWAFTKAGLYTLKLTAQSTGAHPKHLGETQVHFAVGVDPLAAADALAGSLASSTARTDTPTAAQAGATVAQADTSAASDTDTATDVTHPITVLRKEHADITVDMNGGFTMRIDRAAGVGSSVSDADSGFGSGSGDAGGDSGGSGDVGAGDASLGSSSSRDASEDSSSGDESAGSGLGGAHAAGVKSGTGAHSGSADSSGAIHLPMESVIVEVPSQALQPVPADPEFRFIERPGVEVYQLPQAVLGSHIHGEIDPHLWMDVRNVKAYAALLRDELVRLDPQGAAAYIRACEQYQKQLDQLDAQVAAAIAAIPEQRRKLVTSYDAFGYLAQAYAIPVAGLVTPNPAVEPSVADRSRLVGTLNNLKIPAVFASPTDIRMRTPLVEIAQDMGVKVCPLLSDEFTPEVRTYIDLMRFDAHSLRNCLQ